MYNIKYVRSDGKELEMNIDTGYIITTMDGVTGHSTTVSTAQGYEQLGETDRDLWLHPRPADRKKEIPPADVPTEHLREIGMGKQVFHRRLCRKRADHLANKAFEFLYVSVCAESDVAG